MDSWINAIDKLGGKYLDFRRVESQDATNALNERYLAESARDKAAGSDASSSWLMPALMVGGGLLVLVLVLRK